MEAPRSWLKLLDVRSEGKIWIYTPSRCERGEERFRKAIEELRGLIKARGETADLAGRFAAVLKMPDRTEVVMLLDTERLGRMVEEF